MAFKAMFFFFVAALLSLASASFANEDFNNDKAIHSKVVAPIPAPAPQVKAPPVVKPTPPVVKPVPTPTPAPAPPVVIKPPTRTPPAVIKPPIPSPPPTGAPLPPVRSRTDCEPLCAERCKKHSRKKVCERACMTCCDRCKCVPPGTYGNRERCGKCYTNMTTRGNKPKCP